MIEDEDDDEDDCGGPDDSGERPETGMRPSVGTAVLGGRFTIPCPEKEWPAEDRGPQDRFGVRWANRKPGRIGPSPIACAVRYVPRHCCRQVGSVREWGAWLTAASAAGVRGWRRAGRRRRGSGCSPRTGCRRGGPCGRGAGAWGLGIWGRRGRLVGRTRRTIARYSSTALMRRTPAEELSSFWILNLPSSPVVLAWGPPQTSLEKSPAL